jgi:hypothetical protein
MSKIGLWFRGKHNASPSATSATGDQPSSLSPEQSRIAVELAADVSRLRHLNSEAEKKTVKEWMRESY